MTRAGQALTLQARHWEVSRKKARPSFGLGALGLLFSVADRVSAPKLSEQDRLDLAYPYRLDVSGTRLAPGRYRLDPAACSIPEWAASLSGRPWTVSRTRTALLLSTDLTEYERLTWEESAAQSVPTLAFEPLE